MTGGGLPSGRWGHGTRRGAPRHSRHQAGRRRSTRVLRRAAPRATSGSPARARRQDDASGQSLVEFSLVLLPLMLVLLGIIQFGLIFNSYVTMTNAAREGARTGTIYVH